MHALLKKKYTDAANVVNEKVSDAVEAATQMTATLTGDEDDKVHNEQSSRRLSLPHVVQVNELHCSKVEDSPHKLFQVPEQAAVLGREPSNSGFISGFLCGITLVAISVVVYAFIFRTGRSHDIESDAE